MFKNILRFMKLLKWDFSTRTGRFFYAQFFVKDLPGRFGREVRSLLFRKHLGSVGKNLVVYENVRVRNIENLIIGNDVMLGINTFIQAAGGVSIGDHVILAPDVKIWSANHVFDHPDKPVMDQGYVYSKVTIGNNVWIGSNAFIMPGTEIGDGSIVSAGSVVGAKKIPPYTIIAGNPARKIGERKKMNEEVNE